MSKDEPLDAWIQRMAEGRTFRLIIETVDRATRHQLEPDEAMTEARMQDAFGPGRYLVRLHVRLLTESRARSAKWTFLQTRTVEIAPKPKHPQRRPWNP